VLLLISIVIAKHQYETYSENEEMVLLNIDLQDGFQDDTVIVKANNNEVFREEKVKTDLRISLAKQLKPPINVTSGEVELQVTIPTKDLADSYKFIASSDIYIGISVVNPGLKNEKIQFSISDEPFPYL
jgi:hypothetical protein